MNLRWFFAIGFLLGFIPNPYNETAHVNALLIVSIIREAYNLIKDIKNLAEDIDSMIHPQITQEERVQRVLEAVGGVSETLQQFEASMELLTNDELKTILILHTEYYTNYQELAQTISRISLEMQKLVTYSQNLNAIERHTLEDFATWAVSHGSNSVQGLLDKIHFIINGQSAFPTVSEKNFYTMCLDYLQTKGNTCNRRTSPQQIIYRLYKAVTLAELKGFAMMQYSWLLLKSYEKGNFTVESEIFRQSFNSRYSIQTRVIRDILSSVDRTIRICEPPTYQEGSTHIEITRLIQGFYDNEAHLNSINTCSESCGHYNSTNTYNCSDRQLCKVQQKCWGRIYGCFYCSVRANICLSPNNSRRRYEYLKFFNRANFGNTGQECSGIVEIAQMWSRVIFLCDYCFCLCDEPGPKSDRYFSLHASVSTVVTGVRFIKKDRVIHLQAQEGKLLAGGLIDQSTLSWLPLPHVDVEDVEQFIDGRDYHTLSWDNRKFDLDDVDLDASHVVTGVQLKVSGSHLYLAVRQNPIDFATGQLTNPSNDWKNEAKELNSIPLNLDQPNIPTMNGQHSVVDSLPGQYMEFTHSDYLQDAAQTTVPFLDTQNVLSTPAVPLSGVGMYHKGFQKSGGFIAPSIKTFDISSYI